MFHLKEGKITSHGAFSILMILLISNIFLGFPRVVASEGASAAWLLILLSGIAASVGIFFLVKILKRFPGQNLVEIAEILWGTPGAVLTALLIAVLALFVAVVTLREFSETMLTTVLPRTPISVVTFFFIMAMVYGSYKGLEVVTRSSTLLFPFIVGGTFAILLLSGNFINLNNLFPLLGSGPARLLSDAPGRSSIFIEIIFVGVIISNITDYQRVPRKIWAAFGFSVMIYILVEVVYISVFRVAAAERLYIPLFQLARIIYMGRFIQRIEVLFIFVWFFSGALKLTLALYAAAAVLSRGFKIPIYQPLLFPLGLLVFAISFLPPDMLTAVNGDIEFFRKYGALPAWGLPLALLVTAYIRKKEGAKNEKKTS